MFAGFEAFQGVEPQPTWLLRAHAAKGRRGHCLGIYTMRGVGAITNLWTLTPDQSCTSVDTSTKSEC